MAIVGGPDETNSTDPVVDQTPAAPLTDPREQAAALGLNYDTLNDEEREFITAVTEDSATRAADDARYTPDNPLIPLADDADDDSAETSTDDDAASAEGAEGAGGPETVPSGPAAEAPAGGVDGEPVVPPATSPAPLLDAEGNTIVPPWEQFTDPATLETPGIVHVDGIGDIPVGIAQQALRMYESLTQEELQTLAAIRAGQPIPGTTATLPSAAGLIPGVPAADEWDDPQAAAAFQAIAAQVQQLSQGQQAVLETLAAEQERIMSSALDHGVRDFRSSFQVSDAEMQTITNAVVTHDLLPAYVRAAGGDVTEGTKRAYEAVYWSDPARRQAWLDSNVAAHVAATADANTKKAKAQALVSSPGNAPRPTSAAPPRGDRHAQLAGMASALEADMNSNGSN